MAIPVTIANVQLADQNYQHKPFIDTNGNVYLILLDSTTQELEAHKNTDPDSNSFVEQDNAGNPTDDHDYSVWVTQDGDTLHIASYNLTNAAYEYHKFYMSDHATLADTWDNTVVNETIEAPADPSAAAEISISLVARSDGSLVAIMGGDEDAVHGTPYARVDYNIRSTVPAWGGPVALDAGGEVDYHGSVAVLGASDKTHFFFTDRTNDTSQHRSLTSGDSLGSVETNTSSDLNGIGEHLHGPGIFFDDGGTERIRVPYMDLGARVGVIKIDADDGSPLLATDVSDNNVERLNGSMVACLAVDGTTAHLLYSHNTDNDLFHDQADTEQDTGDWDTDTEFLDAVTINRISCNVIDRSGKKLAMVYDDGGTIMYDEKDIGVAGLAAQIANETVEVSEGAVTLVTRGQEVLHRPKLVESLLRGHLVH